MQPPSCTMSSVLRQVVAVVLLVVGGGVHGVSGGPLPCGQRFESEVRRCLEPYWAVAALFHPDGPGVQHGGNQVLAQRLCWQFETALACLHAALEECPSHPNIKYVQSKLGSDWAMEIRDLCVGKSGLATNRVPGEEFPGGGEGLLSDSSSELLRDYFADVEERIDDDGDDDDDDDDDDSLNDDDDDDYDDDGMSGNDKQEIVIVVASDRESFYGQALVGRVPNKVRFRARHHRRHHIVSSLDMDVYSVFEGESAARHTNAAESTVRVTGSLVIVMSLCVLVLG